MGNIINIYPIDFDENANGKFVKTTDFKDKEWVLGNIYWYPFIEKIYNITFNYSEIDTILFLTYNGQALSLLPEKQWFLDVKKGLDNGIYKKVIIYQNEVNWDTFHKILEIEDFFYEIFGDDSRFVFVRNIFKSRYTFTKINATYTFGCFPFQIFHNINEKIKFDELLEYRNSSKLLKPFEKKYHLFSANCNVKEERLHLYQFLEKGNYWDKVNASFFLPLYNRNKKRFNIQDFINEKFLYANTGGGEVFKSHLGELDLDINYHPKKMKYDNFSQVKNLALEDNIECLFQLILETRYNSPCGIVLSEKIFKGFIYKTPFIIYAQNDVLKLLKEYGFKTFDWLVDESYDREIDDKRRFELVLNETKKLLDTPLDELNEKIQKNSDIFEHNFEKIKEFAYSEIDKIYKLFDVQ